MTTRSPRIHQEGAAHKNRVYGLDPICPSLIFLPSAGHPFTHSYSTPNADDNLKPEEVAENVEGIYSTRMGSIGRIPCIRCFAIPPRPSASYSLIYTAPPMSITIRSQSRPQRTSIAHKDVVYRLNPICPPFCNLPPFVRQSFTNPYGTPNSNSNPKPEEVAETSRGNSSQR